MNFFCDPTLFFQKMDSEFYKQPSTRAKEDGTIEVPLFMQRKTKDIHASLPKQLRKEWSQRKLKEEYLQSQADFTREKKAVVNVRNRNHYYVFHSNELWEMDLITINSELRQWSSNVFKYLLCVVDCFDRYAFVECLKSKQPREVIFALNRIFENSNRTPRTISSDRGTEFTNKNMKSFLKSKMIMQKFTITTLPAKAAMVEAFNRTFQQKMLRLLSFKRKSPEFEKERNANTFKKYVEFVANVYNNSVHSTTKFKPVNVNAQNMTKVYDNIHEKWKKSDRKHQQHTFPRKLYNILPGDFVRIRNKLHGLNFEKRSLTQPWSSEIFKVTEIIEKLPYNVYKIADLNDNVVMGKMYAEEMQKIKIPHSTPVKMLKRSSDIFNLNKMLPNNESRDKTLFQLADGTTKWFSEHAIKELRKKSQRNNVADIMSKWIT